MGSRYTQNCETSPVIAEVDQDCGFDITTINMLAYHATADAPAFADLAALQGIAAWDALRAAGTLVITPRLAYELVITASEPVEQGGDGDASTETGTTQITGDTFPLVTAKIAKPNGEVAEELAKLNAAGQVGVSFIYLDILKNKIYLAIATDDSYSGFPAVKETVYFGSRAVNGVDKNYSMLQFKKQPDWDFKLVAITPTDFQVQDLIGAYVPPP